MHLRQFTEIPGCLVTQKQMFRVWKVANTLPVCVDGKINTQLPSHYATQKEYIEGKLPPCLKAVLTSDFESLITAFTPHTFLSHHRSACLKHCSYSAWCSSSAAGCYWKALWDAVVICCFKSHYVVSWIISYFIRWLLCFGMNLIICLDCIYHPLQNPVYSVFNNCWPETKAAERFFYFMWYILDFLFQTYNGSINIDMK